MKQRTDRPQFRAPPGRDTTLLKYFREITSHPLLTEEEELRAAQRIVELEHAEWRTCLGYLPAAAQAAPLLRARFSDLRFRLRFIGRTHRYFRERRGKLTAAQVERYERSVAAIAPRLRRADQDRDVLDTLERWIRENGGRNGNGHGLPALRMTGRLRATQDTLRHVSRRSIDARNRFVSANLRLVISIAKRSSRGTLPLDDLIQEGNLGLIKAVQRYDPDMGYRFSTYASWWIRHSISRALADKSRTVRLPVHLVESHKRLERVRSSFRSRGGRNPTEEELADEMGIPLARLRKLERHSTDPSFSLDRPISDTNPYPHIDFVTDEEAVSPLEEVARKDWRVEIQNILEQLPDIEAQIVAWRYGVCRRPERTLKQIGDHFSLSRERIRQLQQQALCRIRENMKGLY